MKFKYLLVNMMLITVCGVAFGNSVLSTKPERLPAVDPLECEGETNTTKSHVRITLSPELHAGHFFPPSLRVEIDGKKVLRMQGKLSLKSADMYVNDSATFVFISDNSDEWNSVASPEATKDMSFEVKYKGASNLVIGTFRYGDNVTPLGCLLAFHYKHDAFKADEVIYGSRDRNGYDEFIGSALRSAALNGNAKDLIQFTMLAAGQLQYRAEKLNSIKVTDTALISLIIKRLEELRSDFASDRVIEIIERSDLSDDGIIEAFKPFSTAYTQDILKGVLRFTYSKRDKDYILNKLKNL